MFHRLKRIFRKKTDFKSVDKVRLKEAFTVGGITYYEPEDLNHFPWQRTLAATYAFNKLQIGVYPDDIQKYFDIVDKILTGDTFNVTSLVNWKRMNDILRERLTSPYRPEEMMWEVASVIFIDNTESPYFYDHKYATEKIKFWKKHKDVTLFFSQMPLQRLMPFLPATEENSRIFTETVKELNRIEKDISEGILPNLYAKQKQHLKDLQSRTSAKRTGRNSTK